MTWAYVDAWFFLANWNETRTVVLGNKANGDLHYCCSFCSPIELPTQILTWGLNVSVCSDEFVFFCVYVCVFVRKGYKDGEPSGETKSKSFPWFLLFPACPRQTVFFFLFGKMCATWVTDPEPWTFSFINGSGVFTVIFVLLRISIEPLELCSTLFRKSIIMSTTSTNGTQITELTK